MVQVTLRPNGAGYYQNWETLVDGSHYGATSDQNDATYIQTQVQGRVDVEALQDPPFAAGDTINWVQVHYRAYAIGSGGGERIDVWERENTTDRDQGNNQSITRGSWNEYLGDQQTTKPTGGAWTKSALTALQVGVEARTLGSGETLRVSEIWVVVDYTIVAGFKRLMFSSEPPVPAAWNQLHYDSEPPGTGAFNRLDIEL